MDLRFGSFYERVEGLAIPSAGPSLESHLRYSSQQALAELELASAGPGWTLSYTRRLVHAGAPESVEQAWLLAESGRAHRFVETAATSDVFALLGHPEEMTLDRDGTNWVLRSRSGSEERYDESGSLIEVRDRVDRALTLRERTEGADRVQRLTSSSASGLWLERVYRTLPSGPRRLAEIRDGAGRVMRLEYDGEGRLAAVFDAAGVPLRFGYDARNRVVRVEDRNYEEGDPEHGPLLNHYDADSARVLRQTMSNGLVLDFLWAGTPQGLSKRAAQTYDAALDTDPELNQGGGCDRGDGVDMRETTDPEAEGCHISYTRPGERLDYTVQAPRSGMWTLNLRLAADRGGRGVEVEVDGEPIGRVNAPGCGSNCWRTRTLSVPIGQGEHLLSLRFTDGGVNVSSFDASTGSVPISVAPRSLVVRYEDPASGEIWTRGFLHDERRRILREYVPSHSSAHSLRRYDGEGRLQEVVDPTGVSTRYRYSGADDLEEIARAEGTSAEGRWVYRGQDAFGQWTEAEDPTGRVIRRTYDARGLLTEERQLGVGAAQRVWTYRYDALGRLIEMSDPMGIATRYTCDERGFVRERPTGETNPLVDRFEYDGRGAVVRSEDARGVTRTFERDALGRATSVVVDPDGAAERTTFAYDGRSHVIEATEPDGSVTTANYVEAGETFDRVQRTEDPTGVVVVRRYDAFGRVAEERLVGAGPGGEDRSAPTPT